MTAGHFGFAAAVKARAPQVPLPRLGLGLWRVPAASAAIELVLVLLGAYLYWHAATKAVRHAGEPTTKRASWLAGLILVSGLVTLGLNLFGM